MQIIPIAIPLPSSVVPWETDEQGRRFADVPGVGRIVRLTGEQELAARDDAAKTTDPMPLGFDLQFSDGEAGLFVRAESPDDSTLPGN